MILGIGTDIIEVSRFNSWKDYSKEQLLRVFTENEINNSLINDKKLNLQYLASRFAAKEAFYKALSNTLVKLNINKNEFTFLFSCQNVEVVKSVWQIPQLKVNWKNFEDKIEKHLPKMDVSFSISHEKSYALAFVVISLV